MDPIKPLVIATNDRDLMATLPWISGDVCRAGSIREADAFLGFYRGRAILAYGLDVLEDAARQGIPLVNYPFVLLTTAERMADAKTFGPTTIQPENTFVLPAEIDSLHTRLGQYKPEPRNGRKSA